MTESAVAGEGRGVDQELHGERERSGKFCKKTDLLGDAANSSCAFRIEEEAIKCGNKRGRNCHERAVGSEFVNKLQDEALFCNDGSEIGAECNGCKEEGEVGADRGEVGVLQNEGETNGVVVPKSSEIFKKVRRLSRKPGFQMGLKIPNEHSARRTVRR